MKPVEMTTKELLAAASESIPSTLNTSGVSSVGDEAGIRAMRLGQLAYEAKECGSGPARSVPGVTGDQLAAVLAAMSDEADELELERIREHKRHGTGTWHDSLREKEIHRRMVDREVSRRQEQEFKRKLGLRP